MEDMKHASCVGKREGGRESEALSEESKGKGGGRESVVLSGRDVRVGGRQ